MSNKEYDFEGYDWLELSEYLGFPREVAPETFQEFLRNVAFYDFDNSPDKREFKKDIVEACRAYLNALIERNTSIGTIEAIPLWEGLSNIKDKTTFLMYYSQLVTCMWT
jgi:hypothetical protein